MYYAANLDPFKRLSSIHVHSHVLLLDLCLQIYVLALNRELLLFILATLVISLFLIFVMFTMLQVKQIVIV